MFEWDENLFSDMKVGPDFICVDNPDSPEAKASIEYIQKHSEYLPDSGLVVLNKKQFKRFKKYLTDPKTNNGKIEEALLLLAHDGTRQSIKILEEYQKVKKPLKFKIWAQLALEEAKKFNETYQQEKESYSTIEFIKGEKVIPVSDEITINVHFDKNIQKVTGNSDEKIIVGAMTPFLVIFAIIFKHYPEIEQNFPPDKLGITINGQTFPDPQMRMNDGDRVEIFIPKL